MIIEYDIHCFDRTLIIKFPDDHEIHKEEIIKLLDYYYDEWQNSNEDTCLEEYMMNRLSETYTTWTKWESLQYCRETMWICEHCLMAIESREGNQATLRHWVDEQDDEESKCDWCNEVGFDTLYELI